LLYEGQCTVAVYKTIEKYDHTEHLCLGGWDLIKDYTGSNDASLATRIAMQIVSEAAICR